MTKHGKLIILLDDSLGGGLDYQREHLEYQAKKIGLKAEFIDTTEIEDN